MEQPSAPERSARWSRWLRWPLWVAAGLLALVALLVVGLWAVFYTETGTRFALTQGASFYDGMIPGGATLRSVEGTLAEGATLRGVRLEDRHARPLVTAGSLSLSVEPAALLSLNVQTGTIELDEVAVHLVDATEGGFADLGPDGPKPPPELSPNMGPNLPVSITGAVHVTNAAIMRVTPGFEPQPWIEVPELEVTIDAAGLEADLEVRARASMPEQSLEVYALELDLSWSDPDATLHSLLVQSNAGTLRGQHVAVDLVHEGFVMDALELEASAQWLAERAGLTLHEDVIVQVAGAGSTSGFALDLWAGLPDGGSASVTLGGAVVPEPDVYVLVDGSLDEAVAVGGTPLPPLYVTATADAAGDPAAGGEVSLKARCEGCVEELGPLEVSATGFGGFERKWGRVKASVQAEGIEVLASALVLPWGLAAGQMQVDVEELAALEPVFTRFAPGLDLAGNLRVDALCGGHIDAAVGGCRTQLDLARGRPVNEAHLDAFAWIPAKDRLAVALNALRVDARETQVRLQGPGAQLRLSPEAAAVEKLALRISNATGKGHVNLHGQVELEAPRSLDASLRVRDLSLASLNVFVPQLKGAGTLSASVDASGPFAAPVLRVDANGRGLAAFGVDVGELDVRASYADGHATTVTRLDGKDVGEIEVDAQVPVSLNLDSGAAALHGTREARVDASLTGVPLRTAGEFVPRLRSLRGVLDTRASLRGTLRRPALEADVTLEDASLDGNRLPDVIVAGRYDDKRGTVELTATHPTAFRAVSLDAEVPLALDLRRGRARWEQSGEHRVALEVEAANLAELQTWVPEVVAKGIVDATVDLSGDMREPKVAATVNGRELAYDDKAVGEVSLGLDYDHDDELATLQLHAAGPLVSGVGLVAEVPMTLVPAAGEFTWHHDNPHRVRLSINELLVSEAMRWVPPPEDEPNNPLSVDGRLSATVSLDGTAGKPRATAEVEVEEARFDGRRLGRVELDATYANARATADLLWSKTKRHTARVQVDIPLRVDLREPSFVWTREGEHHVRVAVPRIDRVLLEPFLDTGELNAAAALHVVADGNPDEFVAGASLVGVVASHGEKHRVRADVDVTQAEQSVKLDLGMGDSAENWAHVDARVHADVPELLDGGDWKTTGFEVIADVRDVDLRQISALTPVAVQDVRGRLNVHAVMNGTLGDPRIDGHIKLQGGEATVVAARQRLKDVELIASLTNERIEVSRLRLTSAGGSLRGSGAVSISQGVGLAGRIDLVADRLPIRSPGLPRMTFTGKVGTAIDVGLDLTSVEVEIADSRVDVFTSRIKAAAAIPTNDNVGFVDFDEPPPREVTFIPVEPPPSERKTHIKVALSDPLKIIGPSVDMEWGGRIQADTGATGATAEGALKSKRGSFELLGNEFNIEQGQVTLPEDGSNVPFIDVVAVTNVEDVQITAAVRGALPKPELILSSTPSMSQSDIFTVLVTGTTDTQEADPDEVEAKAAGLLAAMSNPALQQQLNDKLKVDKIGVGFGESTDQPILTVGKHVSKDVYAETEYHHNAPKNQNRAELRVEYDFAPRWSLETFFGDAAAGGVDVFWGRAFDTPRSAPK